MSFDQKKITQKVVLPKNYLTESSFDRNHFLKMALGGDEEIWATKLYSGRMQIQK
jgi:hypothetical protein